MTPSLSDYAHQMLGNQNRGKEPDDLELAAQVSASTPAGKHHLRGIPVVGGVGGTQPGTDPLQALLDKEERGELRFR
ncbi:MAG: hypothetical protein H0X39_00080 [Actinobacteria bacterium]|nr:hypothetical protein [Actinomycetota bacterium]